MDYCWKYTACKISTYKIWSISDSYGHVCNMIIKYLVLKCEPKLKILIMDTFVECLPRAEPCGKLFLWWSSYASGKCWRWVFLLSLCNWWRNWSLKGISHLPKALTLVNWQTEIELSYLTSKLNLSNTFCPSPVEMNVLLLEKPDTNLPSQT